MILVKRAARPLRTFEALRSPAAAGAQSKVDDALDDLREDLQLAIKLEHATIPPYLTALYSLRDDANAEIRGLIRSVVVEEMLHMALAANMLSAIGGTPSFTSSDFIPNYPGDLPFDIGNVDVNLAPFSKALVHDVFLKIEEPEGGPIAFQASGELRATGGPTYQTIGEFYAAIRKQFEEICKTETIFDPYAAQLLHPAGAFRVESFADAIRAIDLIVQQGEGTSLTPRAGTGNQLAHYYRFNEIVKGQALIVDPLAPLGYSYTGWPIPYDESGVIPILTNAKLSDYDGYPQAARLARKFNGLYGNLLQILEDAYGGTTVEDANIVGLMFDMKLTAQALTAVNVGGSKFAAPTFEFALTHAAF